MFGKKPEAIKSKPSLGACGGCLTGHVAGCTKNDAELAKKYGLDPKAPDYQKKIATVRKIAYGD